MLAIALLGQAIHLGRERFSAVALVLVACAIAIVAAIAAIRPNRLIFISVSCRGYVLLRLNNRVALRDDDITT